MSRYYFLLGSVLWLLSVPAPAVEDGADINARFQAQAKQSARGAYPREYLGEAVYWTVAGADGAKREALLGEDGAVEADRGGFRVEPFLRVAGKTLAWSDATHEVFLEADALPLARWKASDLTLEISPFGAAEAGDETLYVRYRLRNEGEMTRKVTFWLAARPFQVLPPWQTLNLTGGFSPIRSVRRDGNAVGVDAAVLRVWPQATRFVAQAARPGALVERLGNQRGAGMSEAKSATGEASAALGSDLTLAAGETREVCLVWKTGDAAAGLTDITAIASLPPPGRTGGGVLENKVAEADFDRPHPNVHAGHSLSSTLRAASPCKSAILPICPPSGEGAGKVSAEINSTAFTVGRESPAAAAPCPGIRARVVEEWREKLNRTRIHAPAAAQNYLETLRTALAHILIHRDGALLQPGSRTYARTWIRDAALMSDALLKLGHSDAVRDFLRAYAAYQFEHGGIPCCVDARGADLTPEHDSEGEFIYALAEYVRFTRDTALLRELWPHAERAAQRIDFLRRQRQSPEYQPPGKRAFYGLLPESISHEGYAKHAVHSYWDDFWAYKGLADAAWLAAELGERDKARELAAWRDAFRADVLASIRTVMAEKGLKTIPASADLGDFDPTATAIAFAPTGFAPYLPLEALRKTYDEYDAHLARRRSGALDEEAFTPYEIRNAGAFLRLGQRAQALELLDSMLQGQRPAGWRQWPEIVWTDGKTGKFLGDLPHAWIGAEYIRALRDLFAYEEDDTLVLAAGLPTSWLEGEGVTVEDVPTHFGPLSYRLWREPGGALRLNVAGGLRVPPGGVRLRAPKAGAFADTHTSDTVINSLPADVVIAAPL